MSSWWSPRPLYKRDDALFSIDDNQDYVVKSGTPIERQRELDGTPHSSMLGARFSPPDNLYLEGSKLNKGPEMVKTDPPIIDPDEVVKAFLNQ